MARKKSSDKYEPKEHFWQFYRDWVDKLPPRVRNILLLLPVLAIAIWILASTTQLDEKMWDQKDIWSADAVSISTPAEFDQRSNASILAEFSISSKLRVTKKQIEIATRLDYETVACEPKLLPNHMHLEVDEPRTIQLLVECNDSIPERFSLDVTIDCVDNDNNRRLCGKRSVAYSLSGSQFGFKYLLEK